MQIRNIAIIAHVDHGKTTLLDNMLKQSKTFSERQEVSERVMDCNDLEKERGITILAKCTSIYMNDIKYNIIDTPGHADFGGEVERVLSMVDGVILLVDAAEGPMPQTKFVLSKALALNLKPIVIINKIDRPDRREDEVLDEIYDLFLDLDATEKQLEFPLLYASGRAGWADKQPVQESKDLQPLFEAVKSYIPEPKINVDKEFSMLATILTADDFLGRILIGKVYSGSVKIGDNVKSIDLEGKVIENIKLTKLLSFKGIERVPIKEASAGDIIAIAGIEKTSVSDTICHASITVPLQSTPVDPPTMGISIGVNTSPIAGREGKKLTSRVILERLRREVESNVAITLKVSAEGDTFEIGGRGELQLGVLIENMRREGFELSVSRPKVIMQKGKNGEKLEPIEEVTIEVDEEFSGAVINALSIKKGNLLEMKNSDGGKARLILHVPSRSLIGYQSELHFDTRGTGIMNRIFHEYQPFKGSINSRKNGSLVANCSGLTTAYALANLEERGTLFVSPREDVYQGMIIGEHNRENDLEVNPVRGKQLTNVRASGTDEAIKLSPHKIFTLEATLSYIKEDELVEVTPSGIRLRKKYLSISERKKHTRK